MPLKYSAHNCRHAATTPTHTHIGEPTCSSHYRSLRSHPVALALYRQVQHVGTHCTQVLTHAQCTSHAQVLLPMPCCLSVHTPCCVPVPMPSCLPATMPSSLLVLARLCMPAHARRAIYLHISTPHHAMPQLCTTLHLGPGMLGSSPCHALLPICITFASWHAGQPPMSCLAVPYADNITACLTCTKVAPTTGTTLSSIGMVQDQPCLPKLKV